MDPGDRIPHDDWVDQDLLTRDEASERLVAEIAEVTRKIEAGEGDVAMAPANTPHKFKNLGPGPLYTMDIHLNGEWIQTDLYDPDAG